jgi:hypothetical protein
MVGVLQTAIVCQVTHHVGPLKMKTNPRLNSAVLNRMILSFDRKIHGEAVAMWCVLLNRWHMESPPPTSW